MELAAASCVSLFLKMTYVNLAGALMGMTQRAKMRDQGWRQAFNVALSGGQREFMMVESYLRLIHHRDVLRARAISGGERS